MDCALWEANELTGPWEAPSRGGDAPRGTRFPVRHAPSDGGFSVGFGRTGAVWEPFVPVVLDGTCSGSFITVALTAGRAVLSPPAFARLPVGVLPPPVGQHKVRVAEDGGEAEGL